MSNPKPFNSANFVPVPRVPEWPVSQPENLPKEWNKIAETNNPKPAAHYLWELYFDGTMLIIYRSLDEINNFNGKPISIANVIAQ